MAVPVAFVAVLVSLLVVAGWPARILAEEAPGRGDAARDDSVELLRTERPPGVPGGRLVVALRAEPRTWNPVIAVDNPSRMVVQRLLGDLVHTDRQTQESRPALARSWTVAEDGRRIVVELRHGVRFSDGHPLDADDVLFTFQVYLDEKVGSPNRPLLLVGGEPIRVTKLAEDRLAFDFAEPYAVGPLLFDSIAILPEHRLGAAYREGRFAEAWSLATPPSEVVGLGPFRLERYVPGERLVLSRNPHYWKVDAEGQRLPYLDELVFLFVPSADAEVMRFQGGDVDLVERLSAESFRTLEGAKSGVYEVLDLGPGLAFEFLFFNLNDGLGERLPEVARKQRWFADRAFRQAVSAAIDRRGIVRLVYQNRATPIASHVTPGNKRWSMPGLASPARSAERARELLAAAGYTWDGDGRLHGPEGDPVAFTLVTNSSNEGRVRTAAIIQEDLRQLGMDVGLAPLEFRALVDRLTRSFDYEACILGQTGDLDPNHFVNIWGSDGSNHLWRLRSEGPAEPWQVEVDGLLRAQMMAVDFGERKKLYDRIQTILADEVPLILLVSPNVLVAAPRRLGNLAPAIFDHPTLWNVDELFWHPGAEASPR